MDRKILQLKTIIFYCKTAFSITMIFFFIPDLNFSSRWDMKFLFKRLARILSKSHSYFRISEEPVKGIRGISTDFVSRGGLVIFVPYDLLYLKYSNPGVFRILSISVSIISATSFFIIIKLSFTI